MLLCANYYSDITQEHENLSDSLCYINILASLGIVTIGMCEAEIEVLFSDFPSICKAIDQYARLALQNEDTASENTIFMKIESFYDKSYENYEEIKNNLIQLDENSGVKYCKEADVKLTDNTYNFSDYVTIKPSEIYKKQQVQQAPLSKNNKKNN
jgi:hypothetical protein